MKWTSHKYTYILSLLDLLPPTPHSPTTHLGHHRAASWDYFQDRNRNTDVENGRAGEGEGGMNWEIIYDWW